MSLQFLGAHPGLAPLSTTNRCQQSIPFCSAVAFQRAGKVSGFEKDKVDEQQEKHANVTCDSWERDFGPPPPDVLVAMTVGQSPFYSTFLYVFSKQTEHSIERQASNIDREAFEYYLRFLSRIWGLRLSTTPPQVLRSLSFCSAFLIVLSKQLKLA
jgi:hypothetical protein